MSDFADLASAREQELRDDALAAHARQVPGVDAESAEQCVLCEAPIQEARRLALPGVQTCIDCQEDLDRKASLAYGKRRKR